MNSNSGSFEKFAPKKKKLTKYSDKEIRLKDRDNKRKQKTQNRNHAQES